MKTKTTRAYILLLLTAFIWGGGFVAQRLGTQQVGPFIFNGFRFLIGGLTLLPIIILRKGQAQESSGNLKQTLVIGSGAGLLLFFGAAFQQSGLVYTTAGKAGFITGLYVIIVPLLGLLWGDKTSSNSWLGAALAVIGLYFLSATDGFAIARGDGLILIGAIFWAIHVQFIANFSSAVDPIQLSFVQTMITALVSFAVGFARESFLIQQVISAGLPILYGGIISIGIAHTLQVIGQRDAKPAQAAIILSLEAVFAVILGWMILSEELTFRFLAGSVLMLSGMLLAQIQPDRIDELDL